jgi:hypothetical protein
VHGSAAGRFRGRKSFRVGFLAKLRQLCAQQAHLPLFV